MKTSPVTIAWTLLGVLTVGGVLISLSKRERLTNPTIRSYAPSGMAAFASLLSENGYRVVATTSPVPDFDIQRDVLIVAAREMSDDFFDRPTSLDEDAPGAASRVVEHVKEGGRLLLLPMHPDFTRAKNSISRDSVTHRISGKAYAVERRPNIWNPHGPPALPPNLTSAQIWDSAAAGSGFGGLTRYGAGVVFSISDGLIATNRYLSRSDNADVLMTSLATIAPRGSRIVFVESVYQMESPGLLEILGPGALGAWYQTLFLFVVIVFTLGRRFGLPAEPRPAQTGQRELVDAIADTYRRAKSTRVACRMAYDRADHDLRKALKLGTDEPVSVRDDRIPGDLAQALRRVFEGTIDNLAPADALERCRVLSRETRRFLHRGT